MRYLMIMHPDPSAYAGAGVPDVASVEKMSVYNRALVEAGVLLAADGLAGPDQGFRVRFAGKTTLTDGPFAESKEIIGGYWMIQVSSPEEARAWASRIPGNPGDMVEVRRVFEMSDFPADVQEAAKR